MLANLRSECINRGTLASLHTSALRLLTADTTSTAARAEDVHDVVIVGGGMVGAALAAALRESRRPPSGPCPRLDLPRCYADVGLRRGNMITDLLARQDAET